MHKLIQIKNLVIHSSCIKEILQKRNNIYVAYNLKGNPDLIEEEFEYSNDKEAEKEYKQIIDSLKETGILK